MRSEYRNTPGGLSGNDDAGQLSAWYVFACLGFYPVCPGSAEYALGIPAFDKITIHLEYGRNFTINRKTARKTAFKPSLSSNYSISLAQKHASECV